MTLARPHPPFLIPHGHGIDGRRLDIAKEFLVVVPPPNPGGLLRPLEMSRGFPVIIRAVIEEKKEGKWRGRGTYEVKYLGSIKKTAWTRLSETVRTLCDSFNTRFLTTRFIIRHANTF